jgi:hypothetical protein
VPMKYSLKLAASVLALALLTGIAAFADTPVIQILSPTGSVVAPGFPFSQPITIQITHDSLDDLNVFNVKIGATLETAVSLIGDDVGNPFGSGSSCAAVLTASGRTCSVVGNTATLVFPWQVPSAGSYLLWTTVRHQGHGQDGVATDEETVAFSLISVGYPAPPAIANAYINSTDLKSGAPKVRGCVISQIAANHAHDQKYNAPPGPYNEALVKADVDYLWPLCGGGAPKR